MTRLRRCRPPVQARHALLAPYLSSIQCPGITILFSLLDKMSASPSPVHVVKNSRGKNDGIAEKDNAATSGAWNVEGGEMDWRLHLLPCVGGQVEPEPLEYHVAAADAAGAAGSHLYRHPLVPSPLMHPM